MQQKKKSAIPFYVMQSFQISEHTIKSLKSDTLRKQDLGSILISPTAIPPPAPTYVSDARRWLNLIL